MAMGALRGITSAGLGSLPVQPLSTETILPQEDIILHVKNASGAPITVTLVDPGFTQAGSAATNTTVSVPATTGDMFIAVSQLLVNPATGLISVTFSSTTSVTAEWLTR